MTDLGTQVTEWLQKEGYPFELRVGRLFRKSGWTVTHAQYYTDPETSKPREIDLIARIYEEAEGGEAVTLSLFVECKTGRDKPWVVFASDPNIPPYIASSYMVADDLSRAFIWTAERLKLPLPSLLRRTRMVGHGAIRAFAGGKGGDPTGPYAALKGVVGAAISAAAVDGGLVAKYGRSFAGVGISVPIVVIDAPLFWYKIDEETAKESLERVDGLRISTNSPNGQDTHVLVVTATGLGTLLAKDTEVIRSCCRALSSHADTAASLFLNQLNSPNEDQ